MAITNKLIITKILGKIKEVEGKKLNYTDFLYNSPDILYKYLLEVYENGKRKLPFQDYGECEGIEYHSPSGKKYSNYIAAKNDCTQWLNQSANKSMVSLYIVLMSMTSEDFKSYLKRFNDKEDIFYELYSNQNNRMLCDTSDN